MSAKVIPLRPLAKAYPTPREGFTIVLDGADVILTKHDAYSSVQVRLTRAELWRLGDMIRELRGRS